MSDAVPGCTDEATEILTASGWKAVHTLQAGEDVLTYNHTSGFAEWQPVQQVFVYPAQPREMVLMKGRGHSSLFTLYHRWPVVTLRGYRKWKTTGILTENDRIPVGAACADLPMTPTYSDAFAEVVAWFWTEGTVKNVNGVAIYQSMKNAGNVERIDVALRGTFGPPRETLGSYAPEPRWRRAPHGTREEAIVFHLNAAAGKEIQRVAPRRVVSPQFLRTLTRTQIDMYVQVSMLADNCGPTRLSQSSRDRSEAFQFAVTLAGYPSSLLEIVRSRDEGSAWQVTLHRRKWIVPAAALRMAAIKGGAGWVVENVWHDGLVWRPLTPNTTWYARREGVTYFTG